MKIKLSSLLSLVLLAASFFADAATARLPVWLGSAAAEAVAQTQKMTQGNCSVEESVDGTELLIVTGAGKRMLIVKDAIGRVVRAEVAAGTIGLVYAEGALTPSEVTFPDGSRKALHDNPKPLPSPQRE